MREIRPSGSEGGVARKRHPYPYRRQYPNAPHQPSTALFPSPQPVKVCFTDEEWSAHPSCGAEA